MGAATKIEMLPGISPSVYGKADFAAVRDVVHAEAGIVLPPGKAMLVYSRLAPLVRNSGCATFAVYVEKIKRDEVERSKAVCALTTNHTFFYREAHHFQHFEATVRPGLVTAMGRGAPVRLWSAGCSSGEETWSLAMTLLGKDRAAGRALAAKDVLILASDLATHAIEAARAARYPAEALEAVPADLRRLWTAERDGTAEIGSEAKSIVRLRHLNLLGAWPMETVFDAIFCRNVMIYFDLPTKERLIARFAERLAPGGHLYIGHSERVTGAAATVLLPVGPTIYRKVAA
jgi:chemotaxis protein methyltransferase CheR